MQVTPKQSPGAMMSAVHAVLICGGCFLGNVRVMMSVVHAAVWACCLPVECAGTLPAEWTGHRLPGEWTGRRLPGEWTGRRLPEEWTGLNKCRGGTPPATRMDPCLALTKAWVFSVPESRDPAVSGRDPT
jgi:hypothetical protein